MTQTVVLKLRDDLAQNVQRIAGLTQRSLEDVLTEWIEQGAQNTAYLEQLPDNEILIIADSQLDAEDQRTLSDLMAKQRENQLSTTDRAQLTRLMQIYRQGLVRKAKAAQIAVQRGLRPPLG